MNGKRSALASMVLSVGATTMLLLFAVRLSAKLDEISEEIERDMLEFRDMEKQAAWVYFFTDEKRSAFQHKRS
ncbi:unnamed protein product [Nippostrongylus brasiliensis]|uniref:Col_cuticle_N domain-containing protein n=1 Tax=Nippostrongylus brasiliensis TaxID=27835 RepID=A0A0N4XWU4_NIPBR|nr:unnamed protein product [Nippostrongylus brasiliensis]